MFYSSFTHSISHSTISITFQMFLINRKISKYNLYDTFFKDEESLRDRTEGSENTYVSPIKRL